MGATGGLPASASLRTSRADKRPVAPKPIKPHHRSRIDPITQTQHDQQGIRPILPITPGSGTARLWGRASPARRRLRRCWP